MSGLYIDLGLFIDVRAASADFPTCIYHGVLQKKM